MCNREICSGAANFPLVKLMVRGAKVEHFNLNSLCKKGGAALEQLRVKEEQGGPFFYSKSYS